MTSDEKPDRGRVEIDPEECKGCGLCVEACPPDVLSLSDALSRYGYHPAVCLKPGCTGCAICFFVCPEPGAIRVFRLVVEKTARTPAETPIAKAEVPEEAVA